MDQLKPYRRTYDVCEKDSMSVAQICSWRKAYIYPTIFYLPARCWQRWRCWFNQPTANTDSIPKTSSSSYSVSVELLAPLAVHFICWNRMKRRRCDETRNSFRSRAQHCNNGMGHTKPNLWGFVEVESPESSAATKYAIYILLHFISICAMHV